MVLVVKKGSKMSEESKKKISDRMKEVRKEIPNPMSGKTGELHHNFGKHWDEDAEEWNDYYFDIEKEKIFDVSEEEFLSRYIQQKKKAVHLFQTLYLLTMLPIRLKVKKHWTP